jgi:hypothetical protein
VAKVITTASHWTSTARPCLSRRVANDEPELLKLIGDVLALAPL